MARKDRRSIAFWSGIAAIYRRPFRAANDRLDRVATYRTCNLAVRREILNWNMTGAPSATGADGHRRSAHMPRNEVKLGIKAALRYAT